ncbi:MAG: Wzz/FepE/Etk N-terminal domain-containing protein [Actinomycetota bacterium]
MNLRDYLLILRRRKWIGVVVLAATIATAATLTTLATPVYESAATVFVGPQAFVNEDTPGGASGQIQISLSIAERLTKTYARMMRSLTVAEKAVEDADLRVDAGYLRARLTVNAIEDTTLIELIVRDLDPVQASQMANATARAFVELAADLTRPGSTETRAPIVPLTLFEEAPTPLAPVSPNPSRNLALATVLGLVLSVGMMFAAEYLDVAVRGPDDVERLVHLPVLALIPRVSRDDISSKRSPPARPRIRAAQ